MSFVTNIILHIGILDDEDEKLKEVNAFFDQHERGFVSVSDTALPRGWYGGTKYLECHLSLGAFNYLLLDQFLKHLQAIQWEAPEDLQLLIKDQHETRFRIINVFSGDSYDLYTSREERLLLGEVAYLLEELEKVVTDSATLAELRDWQNRYEAVRPSEEEMRLPKTVNGSVAPPSVREGSVG